MNAKAFASVADLEEKPVSFERLSEHAWAYTAEGDPNTGVVIGDDSVMIIDATATPVMAKSVIAKVREVTDKPIKYVVLTHYHAVRVLGASGYRDEGLEHIIASYPTYELIRERGQQDMESEIGRFPRLFRAVESIPGLTWPTLTFKEEITLWMGSLEVRILHPGAGHTKGDTAVWLPQERVLFSGDLIEAEAACYTGDAYLADWPGHARSARSAAAGQSGAGARAGAQGRGGGARGVPIHARLRHHALSLRPGGGGARLRSQENHGIHPQRDGPEVRPRLHLRALPAVRCHPCL